MKPLIRCYIPEELENRQSITITGADAHHLVHVLRIQPGAEILLFDQGGRERRAVVTATGRTWLAADIGESICSIASENQRRVVLFQGMPKADKLELIIQKGSELGLAAVYPVLSARAVSKPDVHQLEHKLARWRKIAVEASKQCRRATVTTIEPPLNLEQSLAAAQAVPLILMPWEEERATGLQQVIHSWPEPPPTAVALLVGPEGGWEQTEVTAAVAQGAIPVTLGPRILRTETVALVMLSILMYEWGELGGRKHDVRQPCRSADCGPNVGLQGEPA